MLKENAQHMHAELEENVAYLEPVKDFKNRCSTHFTEPTFHPHSLAVQCQYLLVQSTEHFSKVLLLHTSNTTGLRGEGEEMLLRESTCYIRHSTWFFNAQLVSQKVCLLGDKWEYFIFILFYDSFTLKEGKNSSLAKNWTSPFTLSSKEYPIRKTIWNCCLCNILIHCSIFLYNWQYVAISIYANFYPFLKKPTALWFFCSCFFPKL